MKLGQILLNKWLVRVYAFIIFLVIWQIVGDRMNALIFAPPTKVAPVFVQLLMNGELANATYLTLEAVIIGFLAAVVLAIPLGILMGTTRVAEYAIDPYINLLYATPILVLIPVFLIWFGPNSFSTYLIVFIAAVIPMVINTMAGVKNVSARMIELGYSFGFSKLSMWRKIVFPGSLPYIMAGLRVGIGHAVIGAILAEILFDAVGLGNMIQLAAAMFDTSTVISALMVTIGLGVLLTETIRLFENRVASWAAFASN